MTQVCRLSAQVMTREAAAAVAARTIEPVHRTPARLRRDVVPEPMLHPLTRRKLEAAAESLASSARETATADNILKSAG